MSVRIVPDTYVEYEGVPIHLDKVRSDAVFKHCVVYVNGVDTRNPPYHWVFSDCAMFAQATPELIELEPELLDEWNPYDRG